MVCCGFPAVKGFVVAVIAERRGEEICLGEVEGCRGDKGG